MVEQKRKKGDNDGADVWAADHRRDRHAGLAADRGAALKPWCCPNLGHTQNHFRTAALRALTETPAEAGQ